MWELNHKEGWTAKNWCFWAVVLEKTLESLLDCKKIKPVNPKGNQSWIFIRRTDAEAPTLWSSDTKSRLIKDPNTREDWRQEEKGMTENKMVGRHHYLNGPEFEQAPGDGEGQGNLACCSPRGHREWGHNWATKQQFPFHRWRPFNVIHLLSRQNSNRSSKKAQSSLSSHQLHEIGLKSF